MTSRSRIPASAPARVRAWVAGPDRPARVVHHGSDAVYLDVGGVCVGVLSAQATAVPCGLRTPLPRLPEGVLGEPVARVGEGRVALGDTDVVVTRTVRADVPRLDVSRAGAAEQRLGVAVEDRVQHVRDELPTDALEGLAAGRADVVPELLGRGSGLTPVGDDVLAGWLATAVAYSASATATTATVATVAREVGRLAPTRTTLLSSTLLDCARRGDVIPQFRAVLLDLGGPGDSDLDGSADALLRVGHTSGAGMVLGTLIALRHLASRSSA